jgi:hypothetical protein
MARRILRKSNMRSCISHVILAAYTISAAAIIHYGSSVRYHVFALASVTSNESTDVRGRVPSSPQNNESHPFPIDRSLRLKRQDKDASQVAVRNPKEKNVIDDKEDVNTVKRASDSSLNVDQTMQLKRKKVRNSKGAEKDQSSGGTSSGDTKTHNGANRNGRNKHGTKNSGTSESNTSITGGISDQSSGGTPPGVTKKQNGANRDATKKGRKKGRFSDGATSDALTTRGKKKINKMDARKKPQQMNGLTNLDSVMNSGTASPHSANSTAADSFLTAFYTKFDAKKRGGNKQKPVKKKNKVGSAGYHTPGIYADTLATSWGSPTSSWGSSGKDVSYHSGKAGKESSGKEDLSDESGDESDSVWNSDGWEKSGWKPSGWTEVPQEVLYDYKNACPCVYIDAPSWGTSWGGVTAWAGTTSGTGAGSTSGTGAEMTSGTGSGSTAGTGAESKLGTKSSKQAKSNKRKLQWGGAQPKPQKIKVCTCVPTYFPTYNPTHNPTETPT